MRKVAGVDKVEQEGTELRLEWAKGRDPREEILSIISQKELGLLEMRPMTPTVEDIYLKAISGGTVQ
jgi:hypothetical protein